MAETASRTLYHLLDVAADPGAMLDALDADQLTDWQADVHIPDADWLGVPSLLVTAAVEKSQASWCAEVARTTGITVCEEVRRTAALLMLAVDGEVYAIGYDQGYRLIPEQLKNPRFGLSFAIRKVNPQSVRGLVSHALGQARTDIAITPGGVPVPALGIRDHARFVRRLGGHLTDINLTRTRSGRGTRLSADGGCGLHLPLGIDPADLLADIRTIAAVCRDRKSHPDLEFVENILPVRDKALTSNLDQALDEVLGRPDTDAVTLTVPADLIDDFHTARAYHTKIASYEAFRSDDLDLDYLLTRARLQPAGRRLKSLRNGTITLYRAHRAALCDRLANSSALRWLEASVSLGPRHYILLDGNWYEIGASYLRSIRATNARLFHPTPSLPLPAWPAGTTEGSYNDHVMDQPYKDRYTSMDKVFTANPLNRRNRIEICDLLADDDTLVLIKPAHGRSGPLSHLFSQGLVAVQMLRESAEVRAEFAQRVHLKSKGKRSLPENFIPRRLIFAIHLKPGSELTADTLFAFSQVTLAHTAVTLEQWGVSVEVIGIPEAVTTTGANAPRNAA